VDTTNTETDHCPGQEGWCEAPGWWFNIHVLHFDNRSLLKMPESPVGAIQFAIIEPPPRLHR